MENSFSITFSFSQADVEKFASVTGDNNPIHLDEHAASRSIFGRRIMHGYLGASIFSKIFGTRFPGEGTIYLKQDLKFLAPMFVDQKYTAVVELLEVIPDKARGRFKTYITDDAGAITITGEALIQHKRYAQ